jgi:hypothetical protein
MAVAECGIRENLAVGTDVGVAEFNEATLEAWAAELRRISEPQPDNVVPLRTPSRG